MKSLTRWTAIACLTLTLILSWSPQGFTVEDAIIAVVNDELITLKDLRDYARSAYVGLVAQGAPEEQIKTVMEEMETEGINKLIEDKLILSEANKIGLEVREKLVDDRIAELKKKYGSEQNLTNALIKTGATLTDLRNKIRDEMKLTYVVENQVKSKIYINPQEVTDYYETSRGQFGRKERVNLESIFISYGDDREAALDKAKKALAKINEGSDFKEIAQEYSEMPSVGTVERGQLLPLIEETIFKLDLDETSSVVETDAGIYIFKLVGKSPAEIASLKDSKDRINEILYKEKFKKLFMEWLEKIKKEAYIEIK